MKCPICSNTVASKITKWTYYCPKCTYWGSDLVPDIFNSDDPIFDKTRDGENVIGFLDSIRIDSFNKILNYIEKSIGLNKKILDVGCASGLFMELASARGHKLFGIEPNPIMYSAVKNKKFDVVNGYFPEDVDLQEKYDLIIFNDVFEHIPDINKIMTYCRQYLTDNGLLIINAPNSKGVIFTIAKFFAKFGFLSPWNRLWQAMFYTPHLHYFNSESLVLLAKKYSFDIVLREEQLESFDLKGLWKRISFDNSNNFFLNILLYLGLVSAYPFLKLMPKDNFYAVFKNK